MGIVLETEKIISKDKKPAFENYLMNLEKKREETEKTFHKITNCSCIWCKNKNLCIPSKVEHVTYTFPKIQRKAKDRSKLRHWLDPPEVTKKEITKKKAFVPINWENAAQKLNLNDKNLEHLQRDKRIENAWDATTNTQAESKEVREPTPDMKDDRNLAPSLIMWNIPHREFDLDARMEKMKEQDK